MCACGQPARLSGMHRRDRTAAAGMRFRFWVADANSTSIFFPFGKETENDVGGKFS